MFGKKEAIKRVQLINFLVRSIVFNQFMVRKQQKRFMYPIWVSPNETLPAQKIVNDPIKRVIIFSIPQQRPNQHVYCNSVI